MSENPSAPLQAAAHPLASLRERLVQARYQRDWSQQELADMLGTTPLNVSRWERGLTTPNPYFRRKLTELFGLTEIELGLRPDPSHLPSPTQAVRQIQVQSPPPLYDPFLPLPADVPLVGRSSLLAQFKRLLQSSHRVALSALHGLPGVGKTALALELAYDAELREMYPDGLLWAALGPQPNVLGVLSHWGKLLGINEDEAVRLNTPSSWTRTLRATIGTRRLLFVLDDAWHLEHALACQVGGVQCGYVLTTRLPQVAQGFASTDACLVETLDEEESLELLHELAPWAFSQAEEHLRPLVQAVGGLPLALSLIGHYLRLQTHDRQPRRLQTAIKHLQDRLSRLQLAHPRGLNEIGEGERLSLETIIKVSAEQLSQQARQAWEMLSILPARPSSFSEAAALAVSDIPAEILDELSDAGLLEAVGPARYTFHQTIADYGRAQLVAPLQKEAIKRVIDFGQQYARVNSNNNSALEEEASVLSVALEGCEALAEDDALLRLILALAPSWKVRGNYMQAERWLPRALEAAKLLGQTEDQSSLWGIYGDIATQQSNYIQAHGSYEQGLTLARQAGAPMQECANLAGIGWVAYKQGMYEQAEKALQEGLTLARQQGFQKQQAGLLRVLGSVSGFQGRMEQARTYEEEGLAIAQQVGDNEMICALLNDLGVTTNLIGEVSKAILWNRQGLVLAQQQGYRYWEAVLLSNLSAFAVAQGNYKQAASYAQQGLDLARQIGNIDQQCTSLVNLAMTANRKGNYKQAESYAQQGLALAHQINSPDRQCVLLAHLAEAAAGQGNYEQAQSYAQEGLDLARRIGNPIWECMMLLCQGGIGLEIGEYKQSELSVQQGLHLAHQIGSIEAVLTAHMYLGETATALGEFKQAERFLQEGLKFARQFGDPMLTTMVLTSKGALALACREYEQAESSLQEGLAIDRQMHNGPFLWRALYQWGRLKLQQGQIEQAVLAFEEVLNNVPQGVPFELAQARYGLAQVAAAQGKKEEALQLGQEALTTLQTIGHREAIEVRQWLDRLEQEQEV